jgi:hypothetical protein
MTIVTEPVVVDSPIGQGGAGSQGDGPARNRCYFPQAHDLNLLPWRESSGNL